MACFEVAPGVTLEHWFHDRQEVMRTNSAEAIAFREVLTELRRRLDGLIDSRDAVDLVISADFTESVRDRGPQYAAFTTQRGSGTVGGKTVSIERRIVVILDGSWLLTVTTAGIPVINEVQVSVVDNLLVHEAQHVVMHQRRSVIDDVERDRSGYATRLLYEAGLRMVDEYRAEAAAAPLRTGRIEKSGFGVTATAAAQSIRSVVAKHADDQDHQALMNGVLYACQPLWIGLAYFAASLRRADGSIGQLPPALGRSRLWVRYVGELWPRLAKTFTGVPDALQNCPPQQLRTIAHDMVGVMRALLVQMASHLKTGTAMLRIFSGVATTFRFKPHDRVIATGRDSRSASRSPRHPAPDSSASGPYRSWTPGAS